MADPTSKDPGAIPNPFDDKGGGDSTPADPEVDPYRSTVLWGDVPHVTLTPPSGNGGGGSAYAPETGALHVDIGELRSMLESLLSTARGMSDKQNQVLAAVQAAHADPSFWGEQAGQMWQPTGYMNQPEGPPQFWGNEQVQGAAKQFAPEAKEMQEQALRRVSTALSVLGEWMAAVDQSAGTYASTDAAARITDVPATTDPGSINPG